MKIRTAQANISSRVAIAVEDSIASSPKSNHRIGAKQTSLSGLSLIPVDLANWPVVSKTIYKAEVKLFFSLGLTYF